MSTDIWQACGGEQRVRRLSARPYRVVEAQHLAATRQLVDSEEEHRVLEDLIEGAKPPVPADTGSLHFLLSTPFRYAPLRHGSRFGTRFARGIWYGSKTERAAFAEAAYYRLLFFEASAAKLLPRSLELSIFRATVKARRGVDLTVLPFTEHRARLTSKESYVATQALGSALRAAGVEAILYESARDPEHGTNVAVFEPKAFSGTRPETPETWTMTLSSDRVDVARKSFFAARVVSFQRADFLSGGRMPSLAV